MATDTAVLPRTTTPDATQHVWQVPVFLLAILFFVAVKQGWLGGPDAPETVYLKDLDALRNAEERVAPEREELNDLLKRVARDVDKFPAFAQQSHFLLGSGYERLAEVTPGVDESRGYWMLAQQHFGLVQLDNFTGDEEKNKFRYRQLKARAAVGVPEGTSAKEMRDLFDAIDARNAPPSEDPGEALRLKADLALRLTPRPDLITAKDALNRYLLGSMLATPAQNRDRAKILLGDVLFRLNELEKARDWLKELSPDAPVELVAAGKALMGRVLMAMGDWPSAAREWEGVRAIPNRTAAQQATATYNLGVCKLHTNEPAAAAKLFEEALKGPDGPETVATAFRLAELDLTATEPAKRAAAADLLVRAMKDVKGQADLRTNPNIASVMDVVAVFELAFKNLTADGNYEAALKAVNAFSPIAEAGHDREKRAEILATWAVSLKKSGGDYIPKATEAAREYTAYAETQPTISRAAALRRAAVMYKLAGNPTAAVEALIAATKLKDMPDDVAGAVWVELADALIEAKRPEEVWKALNEAMAIPDSISTATRYRLARHFKDSRQPPFVKLAIMLYEQIANQVNVTPKEQEIQEQAQVELADELIKAKDFEGAERWLRTQLHSYPNGPQALFGRLFLGVCLLQLSAAPPPAGPSAAKAAEMRNEALRLFQTTVAIIDAKPKKDSVDAWIRFQASLRILHAYYFMGNYGLLQGEAMELMDRHRNTIEELIIWTYVYHTFKQKADRPHAEETWNKMKKLYESLPLSAFDGQSEDRTREYWERVWFPPENSQK